MTAQDCLSQLEHFLLSDSMNEAEPLFALYSDATEHVPGAKLDSILEAMVKLTNMGLLRCTYVGTRGVRQLRDRLTLNELRQHCVGRAESELRQYPDNGEYMFEATEKGRVEEARDVYDAYYPDGQ